jgi:hypothetical protein
MSESQPPRRLPLVIESLGYVGAVIAVAAGASLVQHFWHNVPRSAELSFAGVVSVALLAIGTALRVGGDLAIARLRSVLWLISTISATVFVAILASQFAHLSGIAVALLAEAAGTSSAIALWLRNRSTLQHLSAFAGSAALIATAIHQVAPGTSAWGPGLSIWLLSALWGTAAHRGYLAPGTTGFVAAAIGLLVGAQLTMVETAAGQLLAVATVAALLAAGIALHRFLLLGFGAAGALVILPQTATRYLPSSAAAALSVCATGLTLLAIAVWLAKSRKTA